MRPTAGNAVKHFWAGYVGGFVRNPFSYTTYARRVSYETSYPIQKNASQRCTAEGTIITDSTREPADFSFDVDVAKAESNTHSSASPNGLLFREWSSFWLIVWAGTAMSGGVFGALVVFGSAVMQLFFVFGDGSAIIGQATIGVVLACVVGTMWAGFVGVLVVPTVAILAWSFFCLNYPRTMGAIAGALTGIASVGFYPPIFFFTATVGAIGGAIAARNYWNSPDSLVLRRIRESRASEDRFHFTINDLLLRTTAAALLLTVWMFVFRLYHHF